MKERLRRLLVEAIAAAVKEGQLPGDAAGVEVYVERPPRSEMGDFSASVAMGLAKVARRPPIQVAEIILSHLPSDPVVEAAEIAPPGYINFRLGPRWLTDAVAECLTRGSDYGRSDWGAGRRVQVEFVSANPVGPIHIGNARGGPYGDVLASLLEATGHHVTREYYINDGPENTQIVVFGGSVQARYLQALGVEAALPEGGYQGEYVTELGQALAAEHGDRYRNVPQDEAGALLFFGLVRDRMIQVLQEDCDALGISFDVWFSEQGLYDSGAVEAVVKKLMDLGAAYERDGAVWLRSSAYGDDEDRVLVRQSGGPTYLASDAAYGLNKFLERGFDHVIYVWGPDHGGYVARLKAALAALGVEPERVEIIIYQIVRILRGGEPVRMSKRAGNAIWLRDIIEEAGRDAVRFFFLLRSVDAHLDFDLELATRQSEENPVYYVQYAHARTYGIQKEAAARGFPGPSTERLELLSHPAERDLMRYIADYPGLVSDAARQRAPHRLTHFALEMARAFHQFYDRCRVLDPANEELSAARLALVVATGQVLRNLLGLLGVSAPERM
ncbi:MAG: arginine--tRNA ligase [Armatimonadetes bacterium]|nr:arginine--tRNA ligase [Armatimonadota bacterium]